MRSLLMVTIGLLLCGSAFAGQAQTLQFPDLKVDTKDLSPKVGTYITMHSKFVRWDFTEYIAELERAESNRRAYLHAVKTCFELKEEAVGVDSVQDADYKAQNSACVSLRQETKARETSLYAAELGTTIDNLEREIRAAGGGSSGLLSLLQRRNISDVKIAQFKRRAMSDTLRAKQRQALKNKSVRQANEKDSREYQHSTFEKLERFEMMPKLKELSEPVHGEYYRKMTPDEIKQFNEFPKIKSIKRDQ